jgi:hypothetical protein
MATDNTILNLGTGGDTIRDIDRGAYKTQVVQLDIGGAASESLVTGTMPVSGSVNADLRVGGAAVTTSNPIAIQPPLSGFIPVSQSGTWSTGRTWTLASGTDSVTLGALTYPVSANNSSTVQLAAQATFVGVIETIQNQQGAQIEVICDQAYTLTINQYADAAGTKQTSQDIFVRAAGVPFNENVSLPGNYFNLTVKNNGYVTTTTFTVDTTFGIMATGPRTVTALGNNRMALNEVGGVAIVGGPSLMAASVPVTIASNQAPTQHESTTQTDLLQAILIELRTNSRILANGLNILDDVDQIRADASFENSIYTPLN